MIALIVLATAQPAPVAFVRALYAVEAASLAGRTRSPLDNPQRWFSPRLATALIADARLAQRVDGVGNLQFDPLCDGQDCKLTGLTVRMGARHGRVAMVVVRFRNFAAARRLVFSLRTTRHGWRVSEIARSNAPRWRLSAVLRGADRGKIKEKNDALDTRR